MKKYIFMMIAIVVLSSCKKNKDQEIKPAVVNAIVIDDNIDTTFQITDLDSSLWILKGYYKNGAYVATYADKCGCNQDYGFVLNYKQDTIPYNKGKYYKYYRDISTGVDNQQAAYWYPVDSIFKGWPIGTSDYFQQYTIISINKDSLVVEDGSYNSSDGSYSVFMNKSELLLP